MMRLKTGLRGNWFYETRLEHVEGVAVSGGPDNLTNQHRYSIYIYMRTYKHIYKQKASQQYAKNEIVFWGSDCDIRALVKLIQIY